VWAHSKEIPAIDLEHQRWRWERNDTLGIDLNHVLLRPSEEALAGRMTVHYAGPSISFATAGNWQSIGEWYQMLAKDRLVATPEIAAKASELTAGKSDFYDKSEAIAEFVQKDVPYRFPPAKKFRFRTSPPIACRPHRLQPASLCSEITHSAKSSTCPKSTPTFAASIPKWRPRTRRTSS
jgi:hypothetical protein